jgi:hypothetical protein
MVLDVAEVEANIHPRSNFVVCVAAFSEAPENVCFAAQKFH